MKNIIFDIGGVLTEPKSGHWFITTNFWHIVDKSLFDIFIEKYKDVNPSESLYIDDRRHILQKAKKYELNILLMDRHRIYSESDFKTINNMNDILEVLE